MKLILENWRGYMSALSERQRVPEPISTLYIFDFDDTLVHTDSHIYTTHKDGSKDVYTPAEYAVYEPQEGDIFDFSDFADVKNPKARPLASLFRSIAKNIQSDSLVILTARADDAYEAIKDYISSSDSGLGVDPSLISLVTLGDSDPYAKSNWIKKRLESGEYSRVKFYDDSPKNVAAVAELEKDFPGKIESIPV